MTSYQQDKEIYEKIKALLEEALEHDKALREQFKIGDALDIVPKQLHTILNEVEENLSKLAVISEKKKPRAEQIAEDETRVFVYLFNGSGKDLSSWSGLFTKDALFGYSVNRPIYEAPEHINNLLDARKPPENHAALAVIVKKEEIIHLEGSEFGTDPLDQPLVRVREGALKLENIDYFQHNGKRYAVGEKGKLKLK